MYDEYTLVIDGGIDLGSFFILLMVLMKVFLSFHCFVTHLYQRLVLHWTTLVVFLMELNMVFLMRHHWVSNLDILMCFCLLLMKA